MMDKNPDVEIYDEPSAVDADDGAVRQKGPDAVDVKMTRRRRRDIGAAPSGRDESARAALFQGRRRLGDRAAAPSLHADPAIQCQMPPAHHR
jgi:hypothetical protein